MPVYVILSMKKVNVSHMAFKKVKIFIRLRHYNGKY